MRRSGNIQTELSTKGFRGDRPSKVRKYGRICDDIELDSVNISGLTLEDDRFRLNLRVQSSYPRSTGEEHFCLPPNGSV